MMKLLKTNGYDHEDTIYNSYYADLSVALWVRRPDGLDRIERHAPVPHPSGSRRLSSALPDLVRVTASDTSLVAQSVADEPIIDDEEPDPTGPNEPLHELPDDNQNSLVIPYDPSPATALPSLSAKLIH